MIRKETQAAAPLSLSGLTASRSFSAGRYSSPSRTAGPCCTGSRARQTGQRPRLAWSWRRPRRLRWRSRCPLLTGFDVVKGVGYLGSHNCCL